MVPFYGDYDTTETVHIPFNTFTSDDPAASSTITNLAAGDIHIHKDGSTTQRSSANGVTVSIDFDSITGNHLVAIDLSDNTDAGYYSDGSRYQVRMEGTTVDGATVNAWIGSFSIGCTLRPTTAGRTLDVTTGGTAGIDWGNVENPGTTVDLSDTAINLCDTTTTNTDMRGTDSAYTGTPPTAAAIADQVWDETQSTHTTAGSFGEIATEIAAILVDTGTTLQAELDGIQADTENIQSRLPTSLNNGAIPADVQRINDVEITGDGSATPFDVP